jgi:hypothetical protein
MFMFSTSAPILKENVYYLMHWRSFHRLILYVIEIKLILGLESEMLRSEEIYLSGACKERSLFCFIRRNR